MTYISCNQTLFSERLRLQAGCFALFCLHFCASPAFAQENVEIVLPDQSLSLPGVDFINTADPALPFAREIIVDVRSPFHWSRYQSGTIGAWSYSVFPDGSAKVMSKDHTSQAHLRLDCEAGVSCSIIRADGSSYKVAATGAAKPTIPNIETEEELATYLAEWILSGTGSPPVEPVLVDVLETAPTSVPNSDPKKLAAQALVVSEAEPIAPVIVETVVQSEIIRPPTPRRQVTPQEVTSPECFNGQSNIPASCFGTTPKIAPLVQIAQNREPAMEVVPTSAVDAQTLFERINLKCSLTGTVNLQYSDTSGSSGGIGKPRGSLGCGANLTDKLSLRVSIPRYAISSQQKPWDPDFTYAWSYKLNEKINLSYANYSARFGSGDGGFLDSLKSGDLRASLKLPKVTFPNDKYTACSLSMDALNPIQESVNLSCGYNVTDKLTVRGTVNSYFPSQQGAFSPDYSYTASYRPAEDWVVSYSNYSNNRWPWNKGENAGSGFMAGSVSVTYSFAF